MVSDTRKILILGGSGYIGRNLFRRLGRDLCLATYHRSALPGGVSFDAAADRVQDLFDNPSAFSHAIILLGETNIDKCAKDQEHCQAVNVHSIIRVIEDLQALNIVPVFSSTDNVFDGEKGSYIETDAANPVVVYGAQKREVEVYLETHVENYCIFRLSKVYGSTQSDGTLFTSWYEALLKGETIQIARDQVISPIFIDDVVDGILKLVEIDARGLYHLCGPDSLSRSIFLQGLIEQTKDIPRPESQVEELNINDFALAEHRPLNVSMLSNRFRAETGLAPRSYTKIVDAILKSFV